jgi:outer membrane protein assembly factor BamB
VLSVILFASTVNAEEPFWNQFRGPYANGTSKATGVPVKFAEGSKEIAWKIPVAGRAWASPVIWGNQIWLTNAPEIQNPPGATNQNANPGPTPPLKKPLVLSAVCLDAETGKVLHDLDLFEVYRPQYTHPTNSLGSCTPWVEEDRLYIHFGTYGTACVDTKTGKKIWERTDIECHHWRGPGSSVVVHGDLLFLNFDGYDKQFIIALDKNTGRTVWKKDRDIDYGTDNGDRKKAYSTVTVVNANDQDLVVSPFAMATIAYAARDGKPVWTVYHGGMNAAARPIVGHGLVYIRAGSGPDSLIAVDPKGKGDITKTHIKFRQARMTPNRGSQILIDDLYFMVNDEGIVTCLDAKNIEAVFWKERIEGARWSSPIAVGNNIYTVAQDGKITVFKASRAGYEQVAENKLDGFFNATPAVAGNSLIIRSQTHVYCVRKSQ